ncbi:hypothetical protein Tco_0339564 [Tanacetum coccineum]
MVNYWVFQTLSKQGDWFSFAKRGGHAPVCMEVAKSWLHDILEGVLVQSGLSRVWRNPMCDPMLRRSDNTVMSIHDFLCMPSLDKVTVREEPHELGTSILSRVVDRTTSHVPAGTVIPPASLEEIAVTRPDRNVVMKTDHAAKQKASLGPKISTNTAKRTRLSQKVSGAGSSGLAARDGVKQTDDGILDDDGQCDGLEFSMEDNGNLNDVNQGEHINVIPLRTFDPSLGLDVTKKFVPSRFSMIDIGEADVILGIKIKHKNKGIIITQSHYIEKILKKFNREDCSPVSTPIDLAKKLKPNTGKPMDQLEYSRAIAGLDVCYDK